MRDRRAPTIRARASAGSRRRSPATSPRSRVFKYANFAVANVNAIAPVLGVARARRRRRSRCRSASRSSRSTRSRTSSTSTSATPTRERNLPDFALYILLFPQLIAGPIIRWRDIAAQLPRARARLADFAYGVRRFVLGLGKKMLIANTLGRAADAHLRAAGGRADHAARLARPRLLHAADLLRLLRLLRHGDRPDAHVRLPHPRELQLPVHRAQSIREFWRRWHISLSNWFRDYLYIPLGGNQRGARRAYANLVIVFLLCGLWHGASWPFVLWGAWHGAVPGRSSARASIACCRGDRALAHVLRAAGRDGRLGAVPLRHARARRSTTTPRCSDCGDAPTPAAIRSRGISTRSSRSTLVVGASCSRRRSRDASARGATA